jgi:hypothetical protein
MSKEGQKVLKNEMLKYGVIKKWLKY